MHIESRQHPVTPLDGVTDSPDPKVQCGVRRRSGRRGIEEVGGQRREGQLLLGVAPESFLVTGSLLDDERSGPLGRHQPQGTDAKHQLGSSQLGQR
jgi:hypothetical protein